MSDLVERLRAGEACSEISAEYACAVKNAASGCQCAEAADEIERQVQWVKELADNLIAEEAKTATLRAEVERLRAALGPVLTPEMRAFMEEVCEADEAMAHTKEDRAVAVSLRMLLTSDDKRRTRTGGA